ncbi:MAG: VWA domain-containing protein [Sandaracinaceae bacterium]|nr:VWA domain-containing protein [Sandaracinaceae bacterium]
MKRVLKELMPIAWTLFFLVPTAYVCIYYVEAIYEVPIAWDSFRFERGWAALLLPAALLVLVARGWVLSRRAPRLALSRASELAKMSRPGWRTWLVHAPTGLRVTVVLLLVLGLMGPQSIHARDTSEVEGIDIMLVLDLSLSMQADDIQPRRFEAMQRVVEDFTHRRPNDRIGAVIFGRDAYTLMPLTTDKQALRSALSELQLGVINGEGTAIGNAVGTGLNRLRGSEAASRVLVLLTDGDSNSGNVSPDQAAEIARTLPHPLGNTGPDGESRRGVRIYTVLMGASADARVARGTDIAGRAQYDRGNYPINPELLRRMAEATGGESFQATDRRELESSMHQILDRLQRSEIEDAGRVYGELYPAFVWPALFLVALEILLAALIVRRWP